MKSRTNNVPFDVFVSHNVSKLVHLDKTLTKGNLARTCMSEYVYMFLG